MDNKIDTDLMTLTRYVLEQQQMYPNAKGDLSIVLNAVQVGCKFVASCVRKAQLIHITGLAKHVNVQGEQQKKLDILANEMFISAMKSCRRVCVMVSEENDEPIYPENCERGGYCICFDPLDGSSNIDVGVNVGTIFSIFRRPEKGPGVEGVLVKGTEMVAAGYCQYGSSCVMVMTLGQGRVDGFTLDPEMGEFILSHPKMTVPKRGYTYSINEGMSGLFDEATTKYLEQVKTTGSKGGNKPYTARYIGSMVADIHRTMINGGVYMYPGNKVNKKGKLRVLYESFPMAMIIEQAGGKAVTGYCRILDLTPEHIHDRCAVIMGSSEDVDDIQELYNKYDNVFKH